MIGFHLDCFFFFKFKLSNTVRIKGRLRNLIARRPQVETLKKTGIMQGTYLNNIESTLD